MSNMNDETTASPSTSPARSAASRTNGAKSAGPTTELGKASSSSNSIVHGLAAAVPVLMPDETLAMIEEELRVWYGTVPVKTPGARQAVARLAGISFRQGRLERLEARLVNSRIERLLAESQSAKAKNVVKDALAGIRGLAEMCESVDGPRPASAVGSLRPAIRRVAEMVDEADVPVAVAAVLDRAVAGLAHEDFVVEVPADAFRALATAARSAEAALLERMAELDRALDAEREKLADEALLGDDTHAKVLDRHRARLAREMMAQLAVLKALRDVSASEEIDVGSGSSVPFRVEVKALGRPPGR